MSTDKLWFGQSTFISSNFVRQSAYFVQKWSTFKLSLRKCAITLLQNHLFWLETYHMAQRESSHIFSEQNDVTKTTTTIEAMQYIIHQAFTFITRTDRFKRLSTLIPSHAWDFEHFNVWASPVTLTVTLKGKTNNCQAACPHLHTVPSQNSSCCMISLNPGLLIGGQGVVRLLLENHPLQNVCFSACGTPHHLLLGLFSSRPESCHLGDWRTPEVLKTHK